MSRGVKMNNLMLIEIVRGYKPLWDRQTSEKTELFVRERMWDDVAHKMGSTKPIVKARWKNLRDAYRKLVQKTARTGRVPRWPYYKIMEFMKDIAMSASSRVYDIALRKELPEEVSVEPEYGTAITSNSDDDPLALTAHNLKMEKEIKKQTTDELPRHFLEVDSERASLNESSQPASNEDDDYQFLLSLYPHFKQVSQSRKLPLRMKIEQVIYEELYSSPSTSNSQ